MAVVATTIAALMTATMRHVEEIYAKYATTLDVVIRREELNFVCLGGEVTVNVVCLQMFAATTSYVSAFELAAPFLCSFHLTKWVPLLFIFCFHMMFCNLRSIRGSYTKRCARRHALGPAV